MLNGFLLHFSRCAWYSWLYLQENMKLRTPSSLLMLIHSKHAEWLIANDENDSSTVNCIVEGVDAIDGSIPMTFLHLTAHGNSLLLPHPLHAVKNWLVVRHSQLMGHQTMRRLWDSYRVVASFSAILGLCPISSDALSPTSPSEPSHTDTKVTVEIGVYNSFENTPYWSDVHYRWHRFEWSTHQILIRSTGGC